MSDDMARWRDEVAEVLGAHVSEWRNDGDFYDRMWWVECSCGKTGGPSHQADALLPLLARVRDEARAEAERQRHCGCAWCCAGVRPNDRGEAHKATCHPRACPEYRPSEPQETK